MYLLSDVCKGLQGELVQDGEFQTLDFCTSDESELFLSFMEKEKFISKMNKNVSCIICKKELVDKLPEFIQGIFVTDIPKMEFYKVHNTLADAMIKENEIDTVIGKNCKISSLAYIAKKNVVIGDNVVIEEFASIKENTTIQNNVFIGAGAVIGGKSFSYAKGNKDENEILDMKDMGQVFIDEGAAVYAQSHVARGVLKSDVTVIGKNAKVDALVHIGHGAKIGERTLIPAGAQIGGNVEIGRDSWIGVNATVANRLKLGENSKVSLGSVVTKDVLENETVSGNFAIEHSRFIKFIKWLSRKNFNK